MASGQQHETYTLGYSSSATTNYYAIRAATRDAAFFLPYLSSGMGLLDCGCGPGSITIGLADVVKPGKVVGIDIGTSNIERAKSAADQQGVSNASFQEGSVYDLPMPENSCDTAFSHAVLNHLGEPLLALKEIYRVLKPGGVVGVRVQALEEAIHEPPEPVWQRCRELVDRLCKHYGGDFTTHQRVPALLRKAGFGRVELSASYESFGNPGAIRMWAERMAGTFTQPPVFEQLTELGWASHAELEQIATAWRAWGDNRDAFFARSWREAVAWKE